MHPNHVVPGHSQLPARSSCNPPPRPLRESVDWPLLVPVAVVIIGLIGLVLYLSVQWDRISGTIQ